MFYLKIDSVVLRLKDLSPNDKIVYAYLLERYRDRFKVKQYQVYVSVNQMSYDLYITRRDLYDILDRLIIKGYISEIKTISCKKAGSLVIFSNKKGPVYDIETTNQVISELSVKWSKK